MKHLAPLPGLVAGLVWLAALTPTVPAQSRSQSSEPVPVAELGANAGAQYHNQPPITHANTTTSTPSPLPDPLPNPHTAQIGRQVADQSRLPPKQPPPLWNGG
jgi:hypothetical protein